MEKMPRGRFSRLLICNCEARAGAFLRAIAILSVADVLSVSGSSKGIGRSSCARGAIAKNQEEAPARPDASTGRKTSCRPNPPDEKPICAGLDASARRRYYGIVLQQRLAIERTRCARRG